MLDELDAACRRVQLSRRFHNDAVRACRQLRRQRMVRLFRLAGHTPWPETFEMDDSTPDGALRPLIAPVHAVLPGHRAGPRIGLLHGRAVHPASNDM